MNTSETILVTGATGQQGGAVANSLLRQGVRVRVLTRNADKAEGLKRLGAEVVTGNLTDKVALSAALRGVQKVFLVTTPFEGGMDAEVNQGVTMVDAAKSSGVNHLVYTSVGSASRNTGIPHFETKWKVEQYIKKVGIPATIIRPVFFMENFGSPWILPAIKGGNLILPIRSDRKLQMVALRDIGEFSAAAFMRLKGFIGQAIELSGDEITLPEAVRLISSLIGRTIQYESLPDDQSEKAGGRHFAIMYRWFNEVGYSVNIASLEKQWGIRLTKFAEFISAAPWIKDI